MKINFPYKKTEAYSKGFSLVEMIVYIAILSLITSALTVTASSLLNTFAHLEIYEDMAHSSTVALERISYEIRTARTVNVMSSTLGISPGTLVLDTVDAVGSPTVITFSLVNGKIFIQEGASAPSPLTSNSVTVTNATFTHTVGPNTQGVLIEITLERALHSKVATRSFRTFVVLDAS
jgi:prepilin-type N-terminal cleavage/methylation domain-containing protein